MIKTFYSLEELHIGTATSTISSFLWLATHSLCQHAVNQCVRRNFWE